MKKRSTIVFIFLFFTFHFAFAQQPSLQWGRDAVGAGNDLGYAINTNENGNDTKVKTGYLPVNSSGGIIADFVANDTIICEGAAVDFIDLSIGAPTSWLWVFTGGSPATSTSQNPSGILYATAGTYNVTLYAANASDTDTLIRVNYITVNVCGNPPVADFIASDSTICVGDPINFFDLSTNNPTSYQWIFFGAIPPLSSSPNPTGILYNIPGNYTVQLIVGNSSGSDTLILMNYINVNVCMSPVADFATSQTSICEGFCVDFVDQSFNSPTSWIWLFPGANPSTSTAANPVNICYNTPGNYDVQLIVTNANGSDSLVITNYMTIFPSPALAISQSGDTLFANAGAVSYQWYYNGNIVTGATTYFYVAIASGDYSVVVTDGNGCEAEAAVFSVIAQIESSGKMFEEFSVRYNKATNAFLLHGPNDNSQVCISLFNNYGALIAKEDAVCNGSVILQMRPASPGLYLMSITSKGRLYKMMVIVE